MLARLPAGFVLLDLWWTASLKKKKRTTRLVGVLASSRTGQERKRDVERSIGTCYMRKEHTCVHGYRQYFVCISFWIEIKLVSDDRKYD